MKRVLFSLLLLLAVSVSVSAQSKIRFGLRLSPAFGLTQTKDSTKTIYKPDGAKTRLGWAYGLTIIYQMADNFGFQTGASWVDRGYTVSNSAYKQNVKLSCLEIPVYLRLRSRLIGPESLGLRIRGLVGASADVNIATKTKMTISGTTKEYTNMAGSSDAINNVPVVLPGYQPISASGVFGLGVEWDIAKVGTFDLGVSYHRGLTNVLRMARANNPLQYTQRMGYLGIDISYLF